MAKFVISYYAPQNYVPGRSDDEAAWSAWFKSMGANLVDIGHPVREATQIGEHTADQRLRGYSVITATDFDAALQVAKACPGLQDAGFGIEVGSVEGV